MEKENKKSIGLKPEVFFKPQIWANRPKGRSIQPNLSNIKNLSEEIEIPNGITAELVEDKIIMRKEPNELTRTLNPVVNVKMENNKIILKSGAKRSEKKIFGTTKAHIKNMIKGLTGGFNYKLQVVSVHFPITANVDKEKNEFVIKNLLGEKKDRRTKIIPGVEVKINRDIVEVSSADIEKAGQMAANIEKTAQIKKKDRRVFQDGIFIIEKPGRAYL